MESVQPIPFRTLYLNGKQSCLQKRSRAASCAPFSISRSIGTFRNVLNMMINFKYLTDIKSIDTFDVLHLIPFVNNSSSICIVVRYFEAASVIWALLHRSIYTYK